VINIDAFVHILVTALFGLGVAMASSAVPRIWNATSQDAPVVLPGLSDAGFRAGVRVTPLAVLAGWLMVASVPWAFRWIPLSSSLDRSILHGLLGCIALVATLMLSVGLWNWPKIVVPPRMRDEPGYLRAMLGKSQIP
jgi:hypothetical protein